MAGILAGKAALITGSTSGIGLAYARALAGAGANVCLHGFGELSSIQKVQDELQAEHGVKTAYSDADLKKPALIKDMVKRVCSVLCAGCWGGERGVQLAALEVGALILCRVSAAVVTCGLLQAHDQFGRLDILVNNAGGVSVGARADVSTLTATGSVSSDKPHHPRPLPLTLTSLGGTLLQPHVISYRLTLHLHLCVHHTQAFSMSALSRSFPRTSGTTS